MWKMKLVVLLAILIPLSLAFWIATCIFHIYKQDAESVSPIRFLIAILAPVLISQWGLKRKSLDKSGALAGLLVGFILTVSNLCFFTALLTFFVAASKATKFRTSEKKKIEDDHKEGGLRNWVQVLCNGGVAAEMSFFYLLDIGCTEKLIDFRNNYSASWYSLAVFGALCCSCGDTFSSEIGSVVGKSRDAILITNFSKVPKGTNGGISLVGSIASIFGGVLLGITYYITLILLVNEDYLAESPPQWPLILIGGFLGLLGSTIDSLLGAWFQYSGYDKKKQCVVNNPGPTVEYICGSDVLDNHSVNLLSSLLTSLLAPRLAFHVFVYLLSY
ncbi:hypothetical protein ACF0H5_018031 [Mactra antiquata]